MSYDDGPLGRRGDKTGPAGDRQGNSGALTRFPERVRRHVREWAGRYVEMRARRYERR